MKETTLATTPWDSADYLTIGEDIVGYPDAVIEQRDANLLARALEVVARATGRREFRR